MVMRILFTAGGTGGHIYPALAVAEEITDRRPDTEILFVCGNRELEKKIITNAGYKIKTISAGALPRKLSSSYPVFFWKLGVSAIKSMIIMKDFKPSLLMATGAYVSGAPVIAAWIMGIPVVMLEQNSYPGIAVKKLAWTAKIVFLGFPEAKKYLGKKVNTVVTGNPLRKIIGTGSRAKAAEVFGLNPDIKTVLVFGGSQGARAINQVMNEIAADLDKNGIQVIWQTGIKEFDKWNRFKDSSKIRILPYIDNMADAYSASDIVVSRSGAMTIAEVTSCGLPGIFIPLPTAAENHQEYNALSLAEQGAAIMIREKELTPGKLINTIIEIIKTHGKLAEMSENSRKLGNKDAAGVISDIILKNFGVN
jgi:UDP-N-acetylglucosamine--N-acetylmuramyl-(pentapeptide) pyrophosphoryl-undecaprenol N-acetylglucosamine transferase